MFLGMLGQKLFDVFFLFWRTGRNLRVSRCTRAPRLRGDCEHNSTQRGQRQVVRRHGFSQNLISGTHSIVYEDSDELRAGFYWPSVCRNICTGRQGFGQRDEPGKVMGGASRMFIGSSLSPLAFLRSHWFFFNFCLVLPYSIILQHENSRTRLKYKQENWQTKKQSRKESDNIRCHPWVLTC